MKFNTMFFWLCLVPSAFAAQPLVSSTTISNSSPCSADWKIKPALLHVSEQNKYNPAIQFNANGRYDIVPNTARKGSWKGKPPVRSRLHPRAHSDNLYVELLGGFSWNTFHLVGESPTYSGPESLVNDAPPVPMLQYETYGRFDVGLKLRFETDQPLDNYNLASGLVVGYVMSDKNNWRALVPSVVMAYDRVEILHSELYRSMGVKEEAFYRFSLAASWNYRIGELFSDNRYVTPLAAHLDARYYYSHELPAVIRGAGFDQSFQIAGTLSYEFSDLKWGYLRQAFITVKHGRQPPAIKEATTIFIGFVIGPKRSAHTSTPNL